MSVTATIRIQQADFDVAQEIATLSKGRTDVGAVVSFTGVCRGTEGSEPIAAQTRSAFVARENRFPLCVDAALRVRIIASAAGHRREKGNLAGA